MFIRIAWICAITIFISACTPNISPWQRGILAKPHMAVRNNAIESALRQHMQVSKEASSGGHSTAGGGCGCN